MTSSGVVRIAQITDMHLMAAFDAAHHGVKTQKTLSQVMAMPVWQSEIDALLCTGDCSEDGSKASYMALKEQLSSFEGPCYLMAGNHDDMAQMRAVFDASQLADVAIVFSNWLLLCLNTQVPGKVYGAVSSAQHEWLQSQIETHVDKHVLLALHHPIASIGSAWLDRIALQNGQAFCAQLAEYSNIRGVIAGHAHFDHEQRIAHFNCMVTPSTAYQHDAHTDTMQLSGDRPGMRLLLLHPDGRLESQVHRIET